MICVDLEVSTVRTMPRVKGVLQFKDVSNVALHLLLEVSTFLMRMDLAVMDWVSCVSKVSATCTNYMYILLHSE